MISGNYWNKVAEKYDAQACSVYMQTYKDTIAKTEQYIQKNDVLLDYACGTGIITIELADKVKEIHAIDISGGMIRKARDKAEAGGIRNIIFQNTDIFDKGFDGMQFDVITAFNVFYFIRNIESTLERIHTLLKPGGICISATDCIGDVNDSSSFIKRILSKAGLLPYIKNYKSSELEADIEKAGFEIMESVNLHEPPPNLFIAAKKLPV